MKNTMFKMVNLSNWLIADPRRAFVILSIIIIVLSLALALPHGIALAEDITAGS